MPTIKISQLDAFSGTPDSSDLLPLVDLSETQTKKITLRDLASGLTPLMDSAENATNAIVAQRAIVTEDVIYVTPDSNGIWSGAPPTTVNEAITRLAELIQSLNGGTGA